MKTPEFVEEPVTVGSRVGPNSAAVRAPLLTQIQALRALAVMLVVFYHLWPKRLTGGYVGVDVFFVISGFLMSRHLLSRSERGVPLGSALNEFYMKRIRRIAPASLVVLAVTATVVITLVSRVKWERFLHEIFASTLYVENWSLAASSTDYLAADTGASPVQHFWSLSVEEQFYFVWPLLLLVVGTIVATRRRSAQFAVMVVVAAASLLYGQYALAANPAAAYFDTVARFWEFALGGLLALAWSRCRFHPAVSAALAWLGLGAIFYSAMFYSGSTVFPGMAALVPVAGTVAVIASGDTSTWWGPHAIFALRPTQFVGDISYSIYLWHWPIIALWFPVLGEKLTMRSRLLVLVMALALGYLSKILVEDRFRRRSIHRTPSTTRRFRGTKITLRFSPYVWLLVAMIPILVVTGGAQWSLFGAESDARAALAQLQRDPPSCYGAEVMADVKAGCSPSTVTLRRLVPSPLIASAGFEASSCQQRATRSEIETCTFGSTAANATTVALVGDSHATQWLPAMEQLAVQHGWQLTTYLMSGCALSTAGVGDKCQEWNRKVLDRLRTLRYQFVVVAARSLTGASSQSAVAAPAAAMARAWTEVMAAGSQVIALNDVPQPVNAGLGDIPSCVYDHPSASASASASACAFDEETGERFDLVHVAARSAPGVHFIDLTDLFCLARTCRAIVGNVLVYLDDNHITPTYSRSLSEPLLARLRLAGLLPIS